MQFILTSILAFISTNIDDIFLLMLFFGDRRFKSSQIFTGQLLGIASLIAISLAISLVGLIIDKMYIGLLGLIPIYLGASAIFSLTRKSDHPDERVMDNSKRANVLSVAGVTIANGGDNIGIYVPLFAAISWPQKGTMIVIFFAMTLVLCFAARYLTSHPFVARAIKRYGHMVTPFVLVALGVYILFKSGTIDWLTKLL